MPSERDMVEMFQVGRTPIREAIRTLTLLGVLEVRQGHGVFIKEINVDHFMKNIQESMEFMVGLGKKVFPEILEVRRVLESHSAHLAAENATEADLRMLEMAFQELPRIHQEYKQNPNEENEERCIEADYNFHKALAHCSHNSMLLVIITSIRSFVHQTSRKLLSLTDLLEVAEDFIFQHKKIMEAVKARQPKRASQAMALHLNHAQEVMQRLITTEDSVQTQEETAERDRRN